MSDKNEISIPTATISRLVTYLRILTNLERGGVNRTSSEHLAEEAQVSAFQVRKDLAYFGRFGTRGMGYTVLTHSGPKPALEGRHCRYGSARAGFGGLPRLHGKQPLRV
jgi:redox-sensing transcriptional repressor